MCRLNARHQDVLWLISKGLTNAEIGRHLGLSERTVKDYVGRLLLVPEASNRTELIGRMLPDLRLQPERSDRTEPSDGTPVPRPAASGGAYSESG